MLRPRTIPFLALLSALGSCGGHFEEADVQDEQAVPADAEAFRIRIPLGSLTIHAGAEAGLRLVGRSRKSAATAADLETLRAVDFRPRLEPVAEEPGVYRYELPDLPSGLDAREAAMILRAELYLPRTLAVDVETHRGNLAVIGRDADVRLHTGSGGIQVENVTGAVEAFTGLGAGILHGVRGSIVMESGGGALLCYVERIGADGVRLKTREPSITLHLPADAAFDLDARVIRSNEGKIGVRNSFDVAVEKAGAGHVARGAVHGGGPQVVLETGAGWISVPALPGDWRVR